MLQTNSRINRHLSSFCKVLFVFSAFLVFVFCDWKPCHAQNCVEQPQPQIVKADAETIENGKQLFAHQWTRFDRLCDKGDGLGPMFNAESCVACHFQGGMGGGGTNDKNVLILSAVVPKNASQKQINQIKAALPRIHPGFVKNKEVVQSFLLHRRSTDSTYQLNRDQLLGILPNPKWSRSKQRAYSEKAQKAYLAANGMIPVPKQYGVKLVVTQRNTAGNLWHWFD